MYFGGKNSRESILNFMSKFLSGETLCKFYQIFPPKVLVYIWTNFSWHFCNYLIEIQLFNKNKIIVRKTLVLDSNDFIDKKMKITQKRSEQTTLSLMTFIKYQQKLNLDIHHHKKKKTGACIFLSFLAGKWNHLNRCYLQNLLEHKQKTGTCVFLVAKKKGELKNNIE